MHYQTVEDYYVFFNLISATVQSMDGGVPGPAGYTRCKLYTDKDSITISPQPYIFPSSGTDVPSNFSCSNGIGIGTYIDPNPIDHLDGQGHNYFRSDNPYQLNSLAGFGEAYYQVAPT
jgi:iron complex outermembrane receptor protein